MTASHPTKKSTMKTTHASTDASTSAPVSTTASAPASPTPVVTPLSAGVVQQCVSLLSQADSLLGPVTALSTSQIRQTLKIRKGGLQTVTDILNLCNQHGITGVGKVQVSTMSAQLAQAKALGQIEVQLGVLKKHLSDATLNAESATWQNATALYTVLQRLAVVDPTIATGLAPVQQFFQNVRTKGKVRANKKAAKVKAAEKTVAENASASTPSATASTETSSAPPAAPAPAAPVTSVTNGATHS